MKKHILKIAALFTAACMAMIFTAYAEEAAEPAETEEVKVLGEQTEDSIEIEIVNSLDKDITYFAVVVEEDETVTDEAVVEMEAEAEEDEDDGNLIPEDEVFEAGTSRVLYLELEDEADAQVEETAEDEEVVYDVVICTKEENPDDEEEIIIHNFPIDDAELVEICMEEDVVFFKYVSLESEEEISTLEDEKDLLKEEAAAEPVQVYADNNDEYVDDSAWDDAGWDDAGWDDAAWDDADWDDAGVVADDAQGADGCIEDGLFYGGDDAQGADGCIEDGLFYEGGDAGWGEESIFN